MKSAETGKSLLLRHGGLVALLSGLILTVAVVLTSASTAAPQVPEFKRETVSTDGWFAAYPDIAVGTNGLVAVVWTESNDPVVDKQNGPLRLAWTSNSAARWTPITIDSETVYAAAVAIYGDTIHVVWSRNKTTLYHITCGPQPPDAQYVCKEEDRTTITTVSGEDTALQVDVAVDDAGTPHVVWVLGHEDAQGNTLNELYYSRQEGSGWRFAELLAGHPDVESPRITHASGLIHLVWIDWQPSLEAHIDSIVRYANRATGAAQWLNFELLADWDFTWEFRARNPSIAANGNHVYAVWDFLSRDDRVGGDWQLCNYAIGYRHSADNGNIWRDVHTYSQGDEFGRSIYTGTQVFKSSESRSVSCFAGVEWIHHLRPEISVATSGTLAMPVLAWHYKAQSSEGAARKVFWDYATQPGSDAEGYIAWTGTPITLSTGLCEGAVDMSVGSAGARLAPVGDLNAILSGDTANGHLHATYHEQDPAASDFWQVLYNNHYNSTVVCPIYHDVYLPVVARNAFSEEE